MNYEIVNIEEKIVVGIKNKTSDNDTKMKEIIDKLWRDLYVGGINPNIKNKVNKGALGLYCDYSVINGENNYTVMVGNEVSKSENPEYETRIIPKGKYAKFHVCGKADEVVFKAWAEIMAIDLEREFVCDFEEYLNDDMLNAQIDIYIGIK